MAHGGGVWQPWILPGRPTSRHRARVARIQQLLRQPVSGELARVLYRLRLGVGWPEFIQAMLPAVWRVWRRRAAGRIEHVVDFDEAIGIFLVLFLGEWLDEYLEALPPAEFLSMGALEVPGLHRPIGHYLEERVDARLRSRCRTEVRRRRIRATRGDEIRGVVGKPSSAFTLAQLRELMKKLTPEDWALLARSELGGETQADLARTEGISRATVSKRISRARRRLQSGSDDDP